MECRSQIELFRSHGRLFREHEELFTESSWVQVLLGQGVMPRSYHPMVDMQPHEEVSRMVAGVRGVHEACVAAMPSHAEFIAKHCAAGAAAVPA